MYVRLLGVFSTNHPHLPPFPSSSTTPCWGQCCEECKLVFVQVIVQLLVQYVWHISRPRCAELRACCEGWQTLSHEMTPRENLHR